MAATDRFDVPPEMRAFAEKSVEQARQAFDGFISAAHQAMSAFEGQAETARKGAKDVTEKAMTFAERNITSTFEFAQELVRARGVEDVLRLHADYIKRQMQVLTEQARELGESTRKAAKDAAGAETLTVACCERVQGEKRLVQPTLDCAAQYFCGTMHFTNRQPI
jgi:phasin